MKKIIVFLIISLFLTSCWEIEKTENKNIINKDFSKQFFAQISIWDFKKELENSEVVLLDVRTPWELVEFWKIRENQKLIDINEDDFSSEIKKLDKTKKYIVYCWHGNRSSTAREFMKKSWFNYVKDLKGGIDAWVDAWENVIK